MATREEKKLATRRALVDAAARLFAERGVDGTTMDAIARAAGTSRTSVFNYFGYKEMLLCEIGARYVADVAGPLTSARRRSARQRLFDMVDVVADVAERQPELLSAIAREMTHPEPARRRQASEIMQYGAVVEGVMELLQGTGRLQDGHRRESDAGTIVDMVAGALVRAGGDFPLSRLRRELRTRVDVFLTGVLKPA